MNSLMTRNLEHVKIIRFTGGEPFINQEQTNLIIDALYTLNKNKPQNLSLVVIQTNGIGLKAREGLSDIAKLRRLPIVFEVSFKGTNATEYQYLTHQEFINLKQAQNIMTNQFEGYNYLSSKFKEIPNISVLARLGIFHSSVKHPTFSFVYPTGNLMFNPAQWDEEFIMLLEHQASLWGNLFDGKLVVEKLKTPGDGNPGMGKRYRGIIDKLKEKGVLNEGRIDLPFQYHQSYIYKKGNEIYWLAAQKLIS
jgi:hypothetical protein